MKHPTQGLATSRAYIVSDNCPWHIRSCRTPKWKDWPPIKSQFSTHTISSAAACTCLLSLSHTYTHIPIRWQLSYSCHCTVTVILAKASWECGAIPGGARLREVQWWRTRGNLRSRCSRKGKACLWLTVVVGIFDVWRRAQARWGGDVRDTFYWCQLRGQICSDYRQGSDIPERAESGQWARSKSTMYKLSTQP